MVNKMYDHELDRLFAAIAAMLFDSVMYQKAIKDMSAWHDGRWQSIWMM